MLCLLPLFAVTSVQQVLSDQSDEFCWPLADFILKERHIVIVDLSIDKGLATGVN